jgi:glutamate racemase
MLTKKNIGIFDSGIGGVTVFKEIRKILPKENYIYYSDSKNNPYGDKTEKEVLEICDKIVEYFIKRNCKAIVIACNTASAKAVTYLRNQYSKIPIIAIEPAYKMVHDYAYESPTLVMATKGTIESEKFNILYKKYNNYKTYILPCIGLSDIIEEGNEEKIKKYLRMNLGIYKGKVNNVVLRMHTLSINTRTDKRSFRK